MKKILVGFFIALYLISVVYAGPKEDFLALINAERAAQGRDPLVFDSRLNTAAQGHSDDMLANGYFNHYSLDGRSPFDRMRDAGYDGLYMGENIAGKSGAIDVNWAFEAWRGSPGHYANMINSDYDAIGIGVSNGYYSLWGVTSTLYVANFGGGSGGGSCTSHDSFACYSNDVYWYNSCGSREDKKEECGTAGCYNNECCLSHDSYTCYSNDVYWYSSCNVREDRKEDCIDGCSDGECVVCEEHHSFTCYNNDVYWYDSCENREDIKEECGTAGCSSGECCLSHATSQCYNNDVYWYSSCGMREERKEDCVDGCEGGECINCDEHASYMCYYGDVYWYDSCGRREERKEDCIDGCENGVCVICEDHSNYACYNGDSYWYDSCNNREDMKEECGTAGCNDGSCCGSHATAKCYSGDAYWYSSCNIRQDKKEECYGNGCENGECVVCEDHHSFACYSNDVYWYDSCGSREDKKEECGSYGCNNDECNLPPCGDNDNDGYVDEDCGGDDCDDNNKQVHPGLIEICNDIDEDCNDAIDDGCKENLIIEEPEQDSEFNTRRIPVVLDVTYLDRYVYYDSGRGWRTFCTRADDCERSLYVSDGYNEIGFKLMDFNGDEYTATLNLFVDSTRPRITRQYPRNRGYASGEFTVKYSEDYLESVDLYIAEPGSEDFGKVMSKTDCDSGRNMECTLEYDISDYEGEEIQYHFGVSDKFVSVVSRPYSFTVDTLAPEFEDVSFDLIRETDTYEKYRLDVEINEYARIEYQYNGISPRRLCSRCDYRYAYFYFKGAKPDYIDLIATDLAGNTEDYRIEIS